MNATELKELAVKIVAYDPDENEELRQQGAGDECLRCKETMSVDSFEDGSPLCSCCAHETVRELALLVLSLEAKK